MGATFARVKSWVEEILTYADLNAEFDNILNNLTPAGVDDASATLAAKQGQADCTGANLPTSLAGELQMLRYQLAAITGETYWYTAPDNTIAALETDVNNLQSGATAIPYHTITAAPADDHSYTGPRISLTAASNVAFGDLCYIASTGKATLVDADAIGTSSGIVIAVASINADASGYFVLPGALLRDDTWNWTVGGLIYAAAPAGSASSGSTLTQTAPSATDAAVQVVGVATHADRMLFYPSLLVYTHV
jgi:hypothetical protein